MPGRRRQHKGTKEGRFQQKSSRIENMCRKRTWNPATDESRNTEGSTISLSQRQVVLYTEEMKTVEFKTHGIFLHEKQKEEGFTLETQMDYFHNPGNRDGKHLVTLTQMSSDTCLVLTKESKKLKVVPFCVKAFEDTKVAIAEQLASSSNASALQRHLFFVHVEADGTVQFQSFDKNYYLCGTNRKLLLQQNQGDGAGLRFIVKPKSGEMSLPRSCNDPICRIIEL